MAKRVLVTRPQPGASRTAARLAALGHQPILLPLTEIFGLPVPDDWRERAFAAVAVTSANAIRRAPRPVLDALASLPCFAIGEETASAAVEAGFTMVSRGYADGAALAVSLAAAVRRASAVAYLCGRRRNDAFERALRANGFHTIAIEIYDAPAIPYDETAIARILGAEPIDTVALYSARAARLLFEAPWGSLRKDVLAANLLCLSAQIAAVFDALPGARIAIAREPKETAMLDLLGAT